MLRVPCYVERLREGRTAKKMYLYAYLRELATDRNRVKNCADICKYIEKGTSCFSVFSKSNVSLKCPCFFFPIEYIRALSKSSVKETEGLSFFYLARSQPVST